MKNQSAIPLFTIGYTAAALLALGALAACKGDLAPDAARTWITEQPVWLRGLVALALLPVPACITDVLGRFVASLAIGEKQTVSSGKPAIIRAVVIAMHIVAVPFVTTLVSKAFPYASAWKTALVSATLLLPLAIALTDFRKASVECCEAAFRNADPGADEQRLKAGVEFRN